MFDRKAWLITQRLQVQILPPLPGKCRSVARYRPGGAGPQTFSWQSAGMSNTSHPGPRRHPADRRCQFSSNMQSSHSTRGTRLFSRAM